MNKKKKRDKNRRTARALENVVKIETEVERLRALGWKKQDFAQALENLLEEPNEPRNL